MDVPGFQIKRTIGKGGMGTAYLAVQESLGRQVVLKTMNTANAEQTDFLERFLNEGRIVAALRHPHIITIYDIGATEEVVYMSMEYVEGGDLKTRIQEGVSPEFALHVVEKIGAALDYAHAEGVIHRDVKPANILFRKDGTPLLSDFGIAKQTRGDAELTSTGTILGSPFYMSPEQAEGMKVDGRSDIYSLGIIFYEMLMGERPYLGDSAIKVIVQHIQSPIPALPERFKRYQPLLEGMIAKDREDRLPSAAALVEQVQALRNAGSGRRSGQASEDNGARTPGAERRLLRHPRVLGLASLALLVAAGFTGFYLYTESISSSSFARPSDAVAPRATPVEPALASARPSDEAPPSPGPALDEVVRALEWLARQRLEEGKLTEPPADNAYYYYSRLLEIDPSNERARAGFAEIAERYVVLAEQEFARHNYRQAQAYITLGLQVAPDNEGLLALQSFIDHRDKSVLENIIDFFTGNG